MKKILALILVVSFLTAGAAFAAPTAVWPGNNPVWPHETQVWPNENKAWPNESQVWPSENTVWPTELSKQQVQPKTEVDEDLLHELAVIESLFKAPAAFELPQKARARAIFKYFKAGTNYWVSKPAVLCDYKDLPYGEMNVTVALAAHSFYAVPTQRFGLRISLRQFGRTATYTEPAEKSQKSVCPVGLTYRHATGPDQVDLCILNMKVKTRRLQVQFRELFKQGKAPITLDQAAAALFD